MKSTKKLEDVEKAVADVESNYLQEENIETDDLENIPYVAFGVGEIIPENMRYLFKKHQLDENGKFISLR